MKRKSVWQKKKKSQGVKKNAGHSSNPWLFRLLLNENRGSIAFEYVLVTLFGVAMTLFVMQYARKAMESKIDSFQEKLDRLWSDESFEGASSGDGY